MTPTRFKKIAFLTPRRGMAPEDFFAYWRNTHGPTVAHAPGYAAWRSRYVQNHAIAVGPVGAPFPYPGAAIFQLPGDGSNEADFSRSATYRDHIRVDELKFIDMDRTVSFAVRENVLRPGNGPVKLLIIGRRQVGISRDAFDQRLTDAYTARLEGFTDRLCGLTLNHVLEGSFSLPGARQAGGVAVDCVLELWFDSEQGLAQAYASDSYRDRLAPAEQALFAPEKLFSFRAREYLFFDQGRPITPPAPPSPD